jgi:hypothetical protein
LDLLDVESRVLLVDVVDAVIHIDALLNGEKHQLMGDGMFENNFKGQHGWLRTRWR